MEGRRKDRVKGEGREGRKRERQKEEHCLHKH